MKTAEEEEEKRRITRKNEFLTKEKRRKTRQKEITNLVRAIVRRVLAHLEDVLEGVEDHLDDLNVSAVEKIAQGLDAAAVYEVHDLLPGAPGGGIGDGPRGLLLGLEVVVLQNLDEGEDEVGLNDRVDLGGAAGGDVRDRPAGLLPQGLLGAGQQVQNGTEAARVDDCLSLGVVSSHNVSHRAEGRSLHRKRGVAVI